MEVCAEEVLALSGAANTCPDGCMEFLGVRRRRLRCCCQRGHPCTGRPQPAAHALPLSIQLGLARIQAGSSRSPQPPSRRPGAHLGFHPSVFCRACHRTARPRWLPSCRPRWARSMCLQTWYGWTNTAVPTSRWARLSWRRRMRRQGSRHPQPRATAAVSWVVRWQPCRGTRSWCRAGCAGTCCLHSCGWLKAAAEVARWCGCVLALDAEAALGGDGLFGGGTLPVASAAERPARPGAAAWVRRRLVPPFRPHMLPLCSAEPALIALLQPCPCS